MWSPGKMRPQQFEIAGDHGEQVVKIVRNTAGKSSDGLQLLRLHQVLLQAGTITL
jgi:hypothetical protein